MALSCEGLVWHIMGGDKAEGSELDMVGSGGGRMCRECRCWSTVVHGLGSVDCWCVSKWSMKYKRIHLKLYFSKRSHIRSIAAWALMAGPMTALSVQSQSPRMVA